MMALPLQNTRARRAETQDDARVVVIVNLHLFVRSVGRAGMLFGRRGTLLREQFLRTYKTTCPREIPKSAAGSMC
jgi:uncharacterized protein YqjF (DUF2071 family)